MKIVIRIVLLIVIVLIAFGIYTNSSSEGEGEKLIGIGVVVFSFVLMPLFIYHRYNGKDLSRYSMRNMFQEEDKNKKENRKETKGER